MVSDGEEIMMITTEGVVIRMDSSSISVIGRNTSGVKLMNVDSESNVTVASVTKVKITESEEENGEEAEKETDQ